MTYRHLLVPLFGYDGDRVSLDAALALARRGNGHVAALHIETDPLEQTPLMVDVGVAVTELVEAAAEHARRRARQAEATFAAWRRDSAVPLEEVAAVHPHVTASFRSEKGSEDEALARHAKLTDIVILARPSKDQAADLVAMRVEDILFGAGRPVLLLPPQAGSGGLERLFAGPALIGWNGSIEATRAVTAALDFLRDMKKVRVLSSKEGRVDAHPAEPLVHYLGWHGIPASVADDAGEGKTAERILAAAHAAKASLLVLGAYSHGRLRQLVLGGVTSHMLDNADLPVLMAH